MSGTVSRQFQAVITVDDRTAAALAGIATRLRAIAAMSGMERIRASALGVQRSFTAVAGTLTRLGVVAGGLGAGIGVGLATMIRNSAETAGELDDLNDRFGVATRQIQAFRYAALAGGGSSQSFTQSMTALNRTMGEAAAGRNQNAANLFRRLGINLRDSRGQIRSTADVLPQLAQAIMRNENAAVRQRIAVAAMGEAGAALIPMFANGAAGLRRMTDEWERYGYAFTDEDRANAKGYSDAMRRLGTALSGVADAIGTQLHPVVTPLVQQFADWVRASRDLIATRVGEWARSVADWVKSINFDKVREGLDQFLGVARRVFDAIGGWRGVIVGVIGVITGPLLAAIATLTAALLTNPIGAAVAAIGLAAAAIYLYWDDIVGFFQGIWDGISSAVARFANSEQVVWLRDVFAALGRGIAAGWDALAGFFDRLWTGIGDAVGRFMASEQVQWLGNAFSTLAGGVMEAWAPIEDFFRSLWSGVSSAFTAAWALIEPIVNAVVAGAQALAAILPERGSGRTAGGSGPLLPQGQGLGRSGAAGGFYDGPALDPDSGLPAFEPLYRQQPAAVPAAAAPQGEVRVRLSFDNVPRGTRVDADAQGAGMRQPELDVGFSSFGAGQ